MIKVIKYSFPLLFFFGLIYFTPAKKLIKSERPTIKTIKKVEYFVGPNNKVLKRKKALTIFKYDIEEYNKQGNILKQDSYDENGNLKNSYSYKYNKNGDQIEMISISTKTGIKTYERSEYVYDDENKVKNKGYESGNQYKPKKVISQTDFFYKDGNLIKKVTDETWLEKKSITKVLYEYNDFNKVDSYFEYIDNEYLFKKMSYNYNEEGILLESHITTYPKGGNPEYIKQHQVYNEKGNVIENIYETGNSYYSKELFEYNYASLKSKYQKYEKDDNIIIDEYYEYQYDKYGNWNTLIKKFPSSKNVWITEREIEYYN